MQSHAPDIINILLQEIEKLLIKIISQLKLPRISGEGIFETSNFFGIVNDHLIKKIFLDFNEVKGALILLETLQTQYATLSENYKKLKERDDKNEELNKYDAMLSQFFKESEHLYAELNTKINALQSELSLIKDDMSIEDRYKACVMRYKQNKQDAEKKEEERIQQVTPNKDLITAWESILRSSKEIMDGCIEIPCVDYSGISFKKFSFSSLNFLGIEAGLSKINDLQEDIKYLYTKECCKNIGFLSINPYNTDAINQIKNFKKIAPQLKEKISQLKTCYLEYKQKMLAHLQLQDEASSKKWLDSFHSKVRDACASSSPTHFKSPPAVLPPNTLQISSHYRYDYS